MSAYKGFSIRVTPQLQAIPGSTQVPNSAGGFVWQIDKWARLERFLILGSEGGTYYISERKLTVDNATGALECIAEDGPRAVQKIVDVSASKRAPKNDPALFALAMAVGTGDDETRKAAYNALPKVARIGTHLFQFLGYVHQFKGWSRGLRTAVANWYLEKEPDKLAYQVIKYRQREGYTHRDVLRLAHPKADDPVMDGILRFAVEQFGPGDVDRKLHPLHEAFMHAQAATSPEATVNILQKYPDLPREALRTDMLPSPKVQMKLLENGMPMIALVRNLGNFSKSGVLSPMSDAEKIVCDQLSNKEHILKSGIHPIQILMALRTYSAGHGYRGAGSWNVDAKVVDALDAAFYTAFGNVEPTNKRTLIGLDVSSSMGQSLAGTMLSAAEGSCAMCMVHVAVEPQCMVTAFTEGLTVVGFSARQRLDDLLRETRRMNFGWTDCSLPIVAAGQQYAMGNWQAIETFIIYTDSETWAGRIHPAQALKEYRNQTGINAKLVVVGMTSNGFSIADSNDAGMLDVVGFDTAVPQVISDFSKN
jgi:60 kDa SS-A/Ro ribonucleoprotein